jgi:pimeloyl-ACP methyl ester carboxylesterase
LAHKRPRSFRALTKDHMSEESSLTVARVKFRTHHHWFHSGHHSILAHLDVPVTPARTGLVIVSPFGWDDICAYRPLRFLARGLAERGVAVLRFDLPGTGDSSGSALDSRLLSAWISSVQHAVMELKSMAGVQTVSVLGVRLGAMLAIASASEATNIENLILWGPSATGRALLREWRAFRNLEVNELAPGEIAPTAPLDGLEVAGFLLAPETEKDLDAFSIPTLKPPRCERILLLSRDNFPHDNKLVQFLEKSGSRVTLAAGIGYQDMLAAPHEPLPFSPVTQELIFDFLQSPSIGVDASTPEPHTFKMSCDLGGGVLETAMLLPHKGESLFSVLSRPATLRDACDWGLLLMNAGGVRHIGPNRMWVAAARRWAARGIPSMRVDFQRVGESDGEQLADIANLHPDDLVEQLGTVMRTMSMQLGCRKFIAVGLCSGAYAAFQSALQDSAVRAAVLLNARLFFWDPQLEPRRLAKRVSAGCTDMGYWRRLLSGEIHPERIKNAARVALHNLFRLRERYIPAAKLAQAWRQIKRSQTRITLVFADGEPLLQEMINENQMPPSDVSFIRCLRVGKTGHTFRALWAQKLVHDLIDNEIEATINLGVDSSLVA